MSAELEKLCSDLKSEKRTNRNKSIERVLYLLNNAEDSFVIQNIDTLKILLSSLLDSLNKHVEELCSSEGNKTFQTLHNKTPIFAQSLVKLIDLNSEQSKKFLSTQSILTAFHNFQGINVKYVGKTFLNILENGIFKIPENVNNLKPKDYTDLLDLLFASANKNDEDFQRLVIRLIRVSVENAIKSCQINAELVNYTTKLQNFYKNFNIDALKLFEMIVTQLSVDYHSDICCLIIEILPKIAKFYSFSMDNDHKDAYFSAAYVSLNVIYPNFQNGDIPDFGDNEEMIMKMLRTLWTSMVKEIKEKKVYTYRMTECSDEFYKLAASLVHILHLKEMRQEKEDLVESRRKISRLQNRVEDLIENIEKEISCNYFFWLNIFNELIAQTQSFLTPLITQQLLRHFIKYTENPLKAATFRAIRICLSHLIQFDRKDASYEWKTFTSSIISDNSSSTDDVIHEKQLVLQLLIKHQKLSCTECLSLLQSFFNNRLMRRNNCIRTVLTIFENCQNLNIPKSTELAGQVVNWLYDYSPQTNIVAGLINTDPVDTNLVAKLAATISINFLDAQYDASDTKININHLNRCLSLKFNSQFLCLETHVRDLEMLQNAVDSSKDSSKNCIIQLNYEMLMRTVIFDTFDDSSLRSILQNLNYFKILIALFNQFVNFKIFNRMNCESCALIKRIVLFLNHIQFQLSDFKETYTLELLRSVYQTLKEFHTNDMLNLILETQQLDGIVKFVKKTIQVCEKDTIADDNDCSVEKILCLKICAVVCVSEEHIGKAFIFIEDNKFDIKRDVNGILDIFEILTSQSSFVKPMDWMIEKLEEVCSHCHADVQVCEKLINLFPNIFNYVKDHEECLDDFLVIMHSFLKKSLKKYYPPHLVKTCILTVKTIARNNPNILKGENSSIICFQIAKYMTSTIFEIHLATIECLTSLLDPQWIYGNQFVPPEYFDFSKKLIGHLNLDTFMKATRDARNDNTASLVQLLVSLLIFSGFHKNEMFLYLVELCMKRNIGPEQFKGFGYILKYFKCSVEVFSKSYKLLSFEKMFELGLPIERFPYFLISSSKSEFIEENLSLISFASLKMNQQNNQELLTFLGTNELDFLESSTLKVYAFISPFYAGEVITSYSNYSNDVKAIIQKLSVNAKNLPPSSELIIELIAYLYDEKRFENVFGYPIKTTSKSFSFNFDIFKSSIKFIFRNALDEYIKMEPTKYLKVLNKLKADITTSVFIEDKLLNLFRYVSLFDIIMDHLTNLGSSSRLYFIRDFIFFIIHIISDNSFYQIKKAALAVFKYHFDDLLSLGFQVFKDYLSNIARPLISAIESSKEQDIRQNCLDILKILICDNYKKLEESIGKMDSFPNSSEYHELREVCNIHLSQNYEEGLRGDIQNFLRDCNRGAYGLRAFKDKLSSKKEELVELCQDKTSNNLVYTLMKRLISLIKLNDDLISDQAAMCLGEIGPLKCANMSYCFDVNSDFYESFTVEIGNGVESFVESLFMWLEKSALNYSSEVNKYVINISENLVNYVKSKHILSNYTYLKIFEKKMHTFFDNANSLKEVDFVAILSGVEDLDYERFICEFVGAIFGIFAWKDCEGLSKIRTDFSEHSFIPVFKLLLSNKAKHLKSILSMLDFFFARTCLPSSKIIYSDKRVIKQFLNLVECIRLCNNWTIPTVNLINVAKACNYCEAHFLAMLYLEIYGYECIPISNNKKNKRLSEKAVQEIATEAIKAIGCKDAITAFLSPIYSRMDYLVFENNWAEALLHRDSFGSMDDPYFLENLKSNGLLSTASLLNNNKVDYEVCWQLGNWNVTNEISEVSISSEDKFQKCHYFALQAIYKKEESVALDCLQSARKAIISIIKDVSTESVDSIYKLLSKLELIEQAQDFCGIQFASSKSPNDILTKWQHSIALPYGDFKSKLSILEQRIRLIESAGIRASRKIQDFHSDEEHITSKYLLNCLEACKSAGQRQLLTRYISKLKLLNLPSLEGKIAFEDAEVFRSLNKHAIAIDILNNYVQLESRQFSRDKIHCVRLLGECRADVNDSTFEQIQKQQLLKSIEIIESLEENEDKLNAPNFFKNFDTFQKDAKMKAYIAIARFADRQYNQLVNYIKSEDFEMKKKVYDHYKNTVVKKSNDKDLSLGMHLNKRNADIDGKEIELVHEKKSEYLCYAVLNYIKYVILNDDIASHYVYRIIGLWFANKSDIKLHAIIKDNIPNIPSYKFLGVLSQLTAQLNSKHSSFTDVIKSILVRCAEEHHNITLYHLLPIVFGDDGEKSKSREQRNLITKDILTKVSRIKVIHKTILEMENMFSTLIGFAYAKGDTNTKGMSLNQKMKSLKDLSLTQVPTMILPVSRSGAYHIISVSKWKDKVSFCGGVNAPKRLYCLCSDGVERSQLLKGNDDLRQDAVMQQVFGVVNELLRSDQATNNSKMKIRTYKIVPMSKRSGIMEFRKDTISFGNVLKETYDKYLPGIISSLDWRRKSNQIDKDEREAPKRKKLYDFACEKVPPIFHYFFFEKFLVPGIWFERRLAYSNSVATISMVGYIVGLGDRHTQNMLIDHNTGEIVHIDFGIAFEQGKIMPTPETVPFRLTRNIVAPMGICQTEGIFKKSCEKTLHLLRENKSVLLTILEVLLYDPLYIWDYFAKKEAEKTSVQHDQENKNLTAQRALLRIQAKLNGLDDGMSTTNVEVQVNQLINEATNPMNLCRLFMGWDAYL